MDESGSISQSELQAELDTLRSLRRRSISQPSDGIDPDLPPSPVPRHATSTSPPTSPTALTGPGFTRPAARNAERIPPVAGPSRLPAMGHSEPVIDEDMPLADNISDLFWLPARLHPEIAPIEFRNFIRDHTSPENLMRRSGSQLGRRKSTLSRQYIPSDSESEGGHSDSSPGISRTPSRQGSFRRNTGLERLTINDLQRLETLARQAAEDGQEGKESEAQLKRLVRRSLSLNPAALLGAADQLTDEDQLQPAGDENDSPLIVPPPGSILRRAARTKIRKNSLLGDGNGHRFGPNKRNPRSLAYAGIAVDAEDGEADQSRRTASMSSVGSLGSLEEASFEREAPPELQRPPRSPDRPSFSAPIPPQYMAPSSTDIDGASSDVMASPERNAVATARSGADMPNLRSSASPPNRSASLPQSSPQQSTSPPLDENIERARREAAERLTASMGMLSTDSRPVRSPPLPGLAPSPMQGGGTATIPQAPRSQGQPDSQQPPSRKVSDDSTPLAQTLQNRYAQSHVGKSQQPAPAAVGAIGKPTHGANHGHEPRKAHLHPVPAPQQVPVPQPVGQDRQRAPTQLLSPPQKEKKSKWARLGLSRGAKDENHDVDDGASIMSVSSTSSGFSTASNAQKGKKGKKEKHDAIDPKRATHPPPQEKEKSEAAGGFFGGLFGSKKKVDAAEAEKRETPAAQQQMPTPPPTASGMLTADGKYVNFYRLPIHIERAVYRLSHIKLANPRRPLFEQVLISNLMFWYLGVINKPAVPPSQMQQQNQQTRNGQQQPGHQRPTSIPMQQGDAPLRPTPMGQHAQQMNEAMPGQPVAPVEAFQRQPYNEGGLQGEARPASYPPLVQINDHSGQSERQPSRPSIVVPTEEAVFASRTVTSPTSMQTASQTPMPLPTRRSPTEASFQVNRPQRGASIGAESRRPEQIAQSPPGKDVQFDGRRKTADLDSYDIISAYADEERRKSGLSSNPAARPHSPPLGRSISPETQAAEKPLTANYIAKSLRASPEPTWAPRPRSS